ncbi:MAG: DNA-binding response regulator [Candidatus Rokuibacteriota bacterium]|nr:MAG: DNA-binding response regulator [Candidatus Rokubacteria bacterium]
MSSAVAVIHVVDDDPSFLAAVSRLLRASGFAVKTFQSATGFLSCLSAETHGCLIADLSDVDGVELQEALVKAGNAIPVIFLTGNGDIPSAVRAMRRGAEDFLCKPASEAELLDAVKRALAREAHEHTERTRLRELRARFATLTPRDCEVLSHVLSGQLNKQIARDLGIDERSVKRHRTSIMSRLHVHSVAELTHLVHAAGVDRLDGWQVSPVPKGTLPGPLRAR